MGQASERVEPSSGVKRRIAKSFIRWLDDFGTGPREFFTTELPINFFMTFQVTIVAWLLAYIIDVAVWGRITWLG
jgi:hypothetical protein